MSRLLASPTTTLLLAMIATIFPIGCAGAEPIVDAPLFDLFSGSDATANTNSAYVGGAYAFGNSIYETGFRIKAVGGYGFYDYGGQVRVGGVTRDVEIEGRHAFAEGAIGYQFHTGFATVRSYLGLYGEEHHLNPNDLGNPVRGSETGVKGALETWLDLGPSAWLSADASYTTAFDAYRASLRLGRRVGPRLAIGLEGAALGNEAYDEGKGGGFIEIRFGGTALTVSGGVSGDYLARDTSGYAALAVYRAF